MQERPMESLRLYLIASIFKFAHLPVAGGLYDQDPKLLHDWQIIHREKQRVRSEEMQKQQQEMKAKQKSNPPLRRRRR